MQWNDISKKKYHIEILKKGFCHQYTEIVNIVGFWPNSRFYLKKSKIVDFNIAFLDSEQKVMIRGENIFPGVCDASKK